LYRSGPGASDNIKLYRSVPERVPERVFFTYSSWYAQRLMLLFSAFNIIIVLDAPVHAPVQLYVIMMMI